MTTEFSPTVREIGAILEAMDRHKTSKQIYDLERELASIRAQRDALAEALRTAMAILSEHAEDDAFLRFQIGNMDLDAKARTALATLEAGKGPQ